MQGLRGKEGHLWGIWNQGKVFTAIRRDKSSLGCPESRERLKDRVILSWRLNEFSESWNLRFFTDKNKPKWIKVHGSLLSYQVTNSACTSEINLEGQGRLKGCGTPEITLKEILSGPVGDRLESACHRRLYTGMHRDFWSHAVLNQALI